MRSNELINAAEQIGCIMIAEGENIRVMNIDSLPLNLKEKIKENKDEILECLKRDEQAKKLGFVVGVPNQIYFCSLNSKKVLYIEQVGSNWEAWIETYINKNYSIKVIYADRIFENVLLKAKNHLKYRI